MTDREELSLKIPAFLRGELSAEEAREIEALAAADADFAADLEFQKALGLSLKEDSNDETGLEFGWSRLSKAIDEYEDGQLMPTHAANDRAPTRLWQYAAVALACIVVAQAVFIGMGADKDGGDQYVMAGNGENPAHIFVRLNETASTKSLTEFLTEHDAVVASGPDDKSQYRIMFADAAACESAQKALAKTNGLFETVSACTSE